MVVSFLYRKPIVHVCEKCGKQYFTLKEAQECEISKSIHLKINYYGKTEWKIGDFVHVGYADAECMFNYYGKIIREEEFYHKIIPIIIDFEGDEEKITELEYYSITFVNENEILQTTQKFFGNNYKIEKVR
jgi:hypothetical protein